MPTIPTIKSLLMPFFEDEFPPKHVFVVLDKNVTALTKDMVENVDKQYYFSGMDEVYSIPTIMVK